MTNVVLVEETLNRIQSHDGIIGFIIVNNIGLPNIICPFINYNNITIIKLLVIRIIIFLFPGIPVRSTLDEPTSVRYAGLVQQLIVSSKKVIKKHDASDDLIFLRLRTKKHEILVIPGA